MRAVQDADIESIRRWRNAQMDVLRQEHPIDEEAQKAYFAKAVWPQMLLAEPSQILVTLLHDDQPIAYGGFVHISWTHRRAELSFLADPDIARNESRYSHALSHYLALIRVVGFGRLRFNRLYLETYAMRTAHIALLERNGFALEGTMRAHVLIGGSYCDSLIHGCLRDEWRHRTPDHSEE